MREISLTKVSLGITETFFAIGAVETLGNYDGGSPLGMLALTIAGTVVAFDGLARAGSEVWQYMLPEETEAPTEDIPLGQSAESAVQDEQAKPLWSGDPSIYRQ